MFRTLGAFLTPNEALEVERPRRLRQRQSDREERTHESSQRDFYLYIARQNHEFFVDMMRHDQQLRNSRYTSKLYTESRTQQPLPPLTTHGVVSPLTAMDQGSLHPFATHQGALIPALSHGRALDPATTHGGGLLPTTTYDGPLIHFRPHTGPAIPAMIPVAALLPPATEGVITIPKPETISSATHAGVPPPTATVEVVPIDSLDTAAGLYAEDRKHIVVLNMANADTPGGWYLSGAGAQEEALCRRSSLYVCLSECARNNFYPISPQGAIFSPDVLVIRKSDEQKCKLLEPKEMWWTSVISVAGLFRPPTTEDGMEFLRGEDRADARGRIRTVLRVAAIEGKKNLVLSALGCGAFRNPPLAVAILFREVLQEGEFRGRFEGVWFSILDRKGSSNYDIFRSVLQGLPIY